MGIGIRVVDDDDSGSQESVRKGRYKRQGDTQKAGVAAALICSTYSSSFSQTFGPSSWTEGLDPVDREAA